MIKISDLVAGETVLLDMENKQCLVLEVLSRTALVSQSNSDFADAWFTEFELNEYFNILETPKPRIPEVGDYFETIPFVRVKELAKEQWKKARLFKVWNHVQEGVYFNAITDLGFHNDFKFCEYIETHETVNPDKG